MFGRQSVSFSIFESTFILFFFLISITCVAQDKSTETSPVKAQADEKKSTEKAKNPMIKLETSHGDIEIELFQDKAPISVANFIKYVKSDHYNGTIFHRVIKGFMIQGGGYTKDFKEKKSGTPIKNEAKNGLSNTRGTIAMARTNVVDSATAQFFINVVDNPFLNYKDDANYGYAVFGKVTKGMDTVDKIRNLPIARKDVHQHAPQETVLVTKASVL